MCNVTILNVSILWRIMLSVVAPSLFFFTLLHWHKFTNFDKNLLSFPSPSLLIYWADSWRIVTSLLSNFSFQVRLFISWSKLSLSQKTFVSLSLSHTRTRPPLSHTNKTCISLFHKNKIIGPSLSVHFSLSIYCSMWFSLSLKINPLISVSLPLFLSFYVWLPLPLSLCLPLDLSMSCSISISL